ncbi:MAG TPA: two-component sensor histidine kinase, partial [Clostridiaceae bacterium]|nr:two-component sensor histidine kinase [Clostridiaceae bacterium]
MKVIKKKSLFTKLMATYVVIIIIAYSVSAVILSVWFYNYYYNQRKDALLREEANLNRIVGDYMTQKTDPEKFKFELLVIDRLLDARVLVVDNFGYVISYSGQGLDKMIGKQITSEEFDEIREGRIVVKKGNFKNMFSSPMLTVGMPVVIHDQVQGAVFLHSPLDEIKNAVKQAYIVVWVSAALAILFSIFVIYIFSDRILIRPLENINTTAKSIAKGEFDKRVQVNSDDEIGDLATSFNYMADSLKNLENMRKNFIANISHELRSPLTSINGFIMGMIDGTIPQEKWTYYLNIVHDEIQRLTRLINDLLDLSRLESGEFSLQIDKFDINELIRERVIKFEDKINKKNINMDVILIEDKVMVIGDRDRID